MKHFFFLLLFVIGVISIVAFNFFGETKPVDSRLDANESTISSFSVTPAMVEPVVTTNSPINAPMSVPSSSMSSVEPYSNLKTQDQRGSFGGRRGQISQRSDYLNWEIEQGFEKDVFTFVRIQYDSQGGRRGNRSWANDYPDCDWNFSGRLHQLTSMKVDPNGKVLRLNDPELFNYPFIFMSNCNNMILSVEEVKSLQKYFDNGGFLMADDFWAPQAWRDVYTQMKKVFPDREPRELKRDHPIFNIVYSIKGTPQVPSILAWRQGHVFEYWHGDPEGDEDPHFWGFFDDNDRLMALLCHNNDIADGWEREGENREYFENYSERVSYPLGINIITYVMTH